MGEVLLVNLSLWRKIRDYFQPPEHENDELEKLMIEVRSRFDDLDNQFADIMDVTNGHDREAPKRKIQ